LDKDKILSAIDLLAENLGHKDNPRVVIESKKYGGTHYRGAV